MTRRAFAAIFLTRLYVERRNAVLAIAMATLVAFIQPRGSAGPMFACTLIAIAIALAQGPGRHPYLDAAELGAPIFGRELARAKAVAPALVASVATMAYCFVQVVTGLPPSPVIALLALASVLASGLVALNATLRQRAARLLYIVMAFATTIAAYAITLVALNAKRSDGLIAAALELLFCFVVGYFALRQYGEALARYDPI